MPNIGMTKPQSNEKKKAIPRWNDNIRELRERSILWHNIWKASGSPRQGLVFDIRKTTRTRYHHAVKLAKKRGKTDECNNIAMAYLEKNDQDFWQMVNKKKSKSNCQVVKIDEASDPQSIAETFADKYDTYVIFVSWV